MFLFCFLEYIWVKNFIVEIVCEIFLYGVKFLSIERIGYLNEL